MKTIDLDNNYDIHLLNSNLAIQRDTLSSVRQAIVNKLSLVNGEVPDNPNAGLNLDIMFGDDVSYETKVAEIRRVIMTQENVESVDDIDFTIDSNLRIGYFKCYVTVSINGESQQTIVGFGV